MRFILWDARDGRPREDEDGRIVSDGLIGRIGPDNAYVRIYAEYSEATKLDADGTPVLGVGDFTDATFRLSGSVGTYRVYRVS